MEQIELLAPAKDRETAVAAINCGADAVYIGAVKFGAREAAGNDPADIAALVTYAHKYWARVYVTVNTLLYDAELAQAEQLIRRLYEAGVDALIIQDVGLLELDLPPLPLFASTQMHNHTPEKVAFLEKVGFQRVILARELSLAQIRAIRAATTLQLETFVHGALCVSYSGQCAMSYALGGRSGNRGQCAQPCRRPYRLVDGSGRVVDDGRYLLSLRDLNLSGDLPELLDAGVRSFKIEGRLKDKTYVMNVVGTYRQRLDALLEGRPLPVDRREPAAARPAGSLRPAAKLQPAASGQVTLDFTPDPLKTFNRGYTQYFLHGRTGPVGSIDTPKAQGEPVGRVTQLSRGAFTLDGAVEIHRGDGLCFFNANRELVGTTVNDVQGRLIYPAKLEGLAVGAAIYRNHDHVFLAALEKSEAARENGGRKIAVRFRLAETQAGLALFAQDLDGNESMAALALEKIPAEKPDQALASIDKQLRKLGGTGFQCEFVRVDLDQPYFIPLGTLNALRRAALDGLIEQRLENYPRQTGGPVRNEVPYPQQALDFRGNVLNQKARDFYARHGVTEIEPAAESGLDLRGRVVMTTRHCIKYQLEACLKHRQTNRLQEPLTLEDDQGHRYPLQFNCAECQMNVYFEAVEEDA